MEKCNQRSLKEMVIHENLTMEKVYEAIESEISTKKNLKKNSTLKVGNYEINIFNQVLYSVAFSVQNQIFNVFIKPIKYKLEINEKESIIIDIIAISQLREVLKQFPFNKILLFCPLCKPYFFQLTYEDLHAHENHSGACLKESMNLKKLSQESFSKFFKENSDFFNKVLKPLEFEPNFELYFQNCEIILSENELYIYEDINKNRINIFNNINIVDNNNSLIKFFGQRGKGKTLSLIGILKYMIPHLYIGTFYINCKALYTLNEPIKIKQLIIDEIPFLFYGNFKDYKECAEIIINFNYDKDSSFFKLINLVIDKIISCPKKQKYIIVLDQYNDKIDKNNKELDLLYDKLIKNKKESLKDITFSLITFSSMNNEDIRYYKIQYINNIIEKKDCKGFSLCEIDNLEYNISIDEGGLYDQNLKKFGYGLKYYNILKYYYRNNKSEFISDFIEATKLHIRANLVKFFGMNEENISDTSNLKILGSFSTDVAYTEEEIKKIINYIPFKYFDIVQDLNKRDYKIIFSFPLVGEVVNEIYADIINTNPNIYFNLTRFELDGGAKGKFFEKILTYYLNIRSSIYYNKDHIKYFDDFPIKYHDEVEVLVLNDNEKFENIVNKRELLKGIYLITQKRYNGKALDIALVNVSDINEIIGIQISIHKKNIFKANEVDDFLWNLNRNIKNNYDLEVKKENLYFCYIFDWNNKNSSMIDRCRINGMKYFFFDVTTKSFVDYYGNKVNNLKVYLLSPQSTTLDARKAGYHILDEYYIRRPKQSNEQKEKETQNNNYVFSEEPFVKLNECQKNSIKKFFKNELFLKVLPEIDYKHSMNCLVGKFLEKNIDFCISPYKGNDVTNNFDSIVLLTNSSRHYLIKNNGGIYPYTGNYSNEYDYYSISQL